MKTGKMNGNCVMCKQPTSWNSNTGKYNRFCDNPKCKDEYVKIMKSRMVAKYGKTHLLNDPNKQREMLAHRSISGVYKWSDGKHESTYTGSYELDFLKTLDHFFEWDPEDISMPSPHTYTYKYEGEDKFYIPDVFIHSLDLEIEIKDGGDNPNNHYKIQAVDKNKEALKDEVLCSQKMFHYIKITNKNYENFFQFLKEAKKEFEKYGDEKKIPRIFKIEDIKGTSTIIKESTTKHINDMIIKFKEFNDKPYKEHDLFLSLKYELVKNNPKEMQNFLSNLIKHAKFKDDMVYIHKLVKKTNDYYKLRIRKYPNEKDMYDEYYNWIQNGGMNNEVKVKETKLKIKENYEIVDESYIINTMKESSISIPQMTYYLQNEYEEEMRKYLNTYKKYYNLMLKEQPSAVKHINEDIKKCLIVIDGMANKGVENNLVQFAKDDLGEIVKASKHGKPIKVYEGTNVINLKVVYNNPNRKQVFSLNDTTSKIIVEENYIVQRDKVGTHCSVTPYYNEIDRINEISFQVELPDYVDIDNILNNLREGVIISNLFKFEDREFKFIREASLKLFGCYPINIREV
jgi:hypothetical protein